MPNQCWLSVFVNRSCASAVVTARSRDEVIGYGAQTGNRIASCGRSRWGSVQEIPETVERACDALARIVDDKGFANGRVVQSGESSITWSRRRRSQRASKERLLPICVIDTKHGLVLLVRLQARSDTFLRGRCKFEQVVGKARKFVFSMKVNPAGVVPPAKLASVVESVRQDLRSTVPNY